MLEDLKQKYGQNIEKYSFLQDTGLQLVTIYTLLVGVSGLYSVGFVNLEIMGAVTAIVLLLSYRAEQEVLELGSRYFGALLFLVTLTGFILRIHNLGGQGMWFDETITSNAVRGFLETGKPVFPSGAEYWRAFPHTLMAAASSKILGFTDFALRLPSVLIGTLTLPLTYLTGKELFDRETGLLAATLLAFATWEIAWSRQARMYPVLQTLYLFATLLTYRLADETTIRDVSLITLTLILATLTHPFAYILPVLALAYITAVRLGLEKKISDLQEIKEGLKESIKPVGALLLALLLVALVSGGFTSAIERVISVDIDHLATYHSWISNNLSALYLLAITGSIIPFTRKKTRQGTLLLLFTLPTLYIITFNVKLVASRYLYFVMPFLTLWTAQTLKTASKYISKNLELEGARKYTLAIITLLVLTTSSFTLIPQTDYRLGVNAPQPDFKGAYNHVENKSQSGDILISGWTAPALHYHRAPDYWLRFDHTGAGSYPVVNSTDRYAGAEVIYNQTQLEQVMQEDPRGWIVLDTRAYSRQSPEIRKLADNQTLSYQGREIQVWKWTNQERN